jgi:hypothetical protein
MKTIEKNALKNLLEMVFIFYLQGKINAPIMFDSTPKTKKLLSLRKEFHGKYAAGEDGIHRFHFTGDLLNELSVMAGRMEKVEDFCIALFCSDTEQPCILTFPELAEMASRSEKEGYFNLSVEIDKRTFKVISHSCSGNCFEKNISKKASLKKILH